MKSGKTFRTAVSALFLAMYVMVALVSIHFHHHTSEIRTEVSDKDSREFTQNPKKLSAEDCFSCHMLYSNFAEVPQDFAVHFSAGYLFTEQLTAYLNAFSALEHASVFLRGPPAA